MAINNCIHKIKKEEEEKKCSLYRGRNNLILVNYHISKSEENKRRRPEEWYLGQCLLKVAIASDQYRYYGPQERGQGRRVTNTGARTGFLEKEVVTYQTLQVHT
jgi:hypothetical protein